MKKRHDREQTLHGSKPGTARARHAAGRRGHTGLSGLVAALCAGLVLAGSGCMLDSEDDDLDSTTLALSNDDTYRGLAEYWSPRIYQDTDSTEYKSDYITKFNFDGDYNGLNNWENMSSRSTVPAYVYYSVSETYTHYFIGYYIFHPRDWHEILSADRHENDLEGILLAVRKTGGYGTLEAMETQAHGHQYQYANSSGITSGTDNVDGNVTVYGSHHPRIFIEAKGHGIYACDSRCSSAPGGDGIVYDLGTVADSPNSGTGNWSSVYRYKLIAMDADGSLDGNQGFWYRRYDICDTCTFGTWGKIRGDNYNTNSANAPWNWDDPDDGQSWVGDASCDPALMFDIHLNGTPFDSNFSHTYINHVYRTHRIAVYAVRSDKDRDSFGGNSDIYAKVTATGSNAGSEERLNAKAWKRDNANAGTWYGFEYGIYNAEGERSFGDAFQHNSFCRPGNSQVNVSVYDSDSPSSDDYMGGITLTNSANYASGIDLGDGRIQFVLTVY